MSEIIIAVDGTERGEDAVVFGRRLAQFTGARAVLAHAFPYDDIRGRGSNEATATRCACSPRSAIATASRRRRVRSRRLVARARAARARRGRRRRALVVGIGRAGRVLPGSTGERAARIAVRRRRGAQGLSRDRARPAAAHRLRIRRGRWPPCTADLARALGAELDVIRAFRPDAPVLVHRGIADLAIHARAELDAASRRSPRCAAPTGSSWQRRGRRARRAPRTGSTSSRRLAPLCCCTRSCWAGSPVA